MNVSHHTYAAPKPKNYVGIGFVVAVHLAAIYALSAGLVKTPPKPHEATVLLPPIPDKQPDPIKKVEKYTPDKPVLFIAPPIEVPVPPTWNEAQVVVVQAPADPIPSGPIAAAGPTVTVPPAPPIRATGIQSPGAVCSVMPKPEVPALNWTGEAVLHVVATVRGGRVVGTEFSLLQGALDAKSKRALQRSAESALAGYQCLGDASFQQDFAFRLE